MYASQRLLLCLFLSLSCTAGSAQMKVVEADPVAGIWRGHSICTVKDSPCHDEVNVYHVSAIPVKPGIYFVSGNKVVDGKEEVMGTGEWRYDARTHELVYEFPRGVFHLKIDGERMEGDLKLPDGTLYRRIFLQRVR